MSCRCWIPGMGVPVCDEDCECGCHDDEDQAALELEDESLFDADELGLDPEDDDIRRGYAR